MELFTPDFGLVFWMFVGFAILFLILWKFAWPTILKSVDERADLINKGVEYAQNAKEQLDNARAEADKYITQARTQQAQMLRDADKMKTQLIEEARAERSPETTAQPSQRNRPRNRRQSRQRKYGRPSGAVTTCQYIPRPNREQQLINTRTRLTPIASRKPQPTDIRQWIKDYCHAATPKHSTNTP